MHPKRAKSFMYIVNDKNIQMKKKLRLVNSWNFSLEGSIYGFEYKFWDLQGEPRIFMGK